MLLLQSSVQGDAKDESKMTSGAWCVNATDLRGDNSGVHVEC